MSGRKSTRLRLSTMTQALYQSVIDETVGHVKSLFIERGIPEDILRELRALWEENVSKSGAIGEYIGDTKEKDKPQDKRPLDSEGGEDEGTIKRPRQDETQDGEDEGTIKKPRQDEIQDGEDELGSDLDDSEIGELDDVQGADATGKVDDDSSSNTVLGAFQKVTRAKNRWKVALNGCVGLFNGREYLFKKMLLELDWS